MSAREQLIARFEVIPGVAYADIVAVQPGDGSQTPMCQLTCYFLGFPDTAQYSKSKARFEAPESVVDDISAQDNLVSHMADLVSRYKPPA